MILSFISIEVDHSSGENSPSKSGSDERPMPKVGSSIGHINFSPNTIISAKFNETDGNCCSMYFPAHTGKNLEAHV